MADLLLAHEATVRLAAFFGVFAAMAAWEVLAPRRVQQVPRRVRWPGNLGIVALNAILVRLVFPTTAIAFAAYAQAQGWGLLNALDWPAWPTVVVGFILLDLAIYLQHVLFHAVPALWRLHRMHHADVEFDVSNGLRFHPLEIVLSMVLKLAAISALGAPPVAVLAFEIVLNAASMFNHGNVRVAPRIDRALRWLVVTPDMHRVHHSWHRDEHDSNFGFNLPWWDRMLGTYRAQPRDGHEGMTIGLHDFRDPRWLRLDRMLALPIDR